MERSGFWSDPVRLFLIACGRQDVVDRGDALAQRVAALMVASRERIDQYLQNGDLYNGRGGSSSEPSILSGDLSVVASLDEFVNVRLRSEIAALEQLLSVFEDLRTRGSSCPPPDPDFASLVANSARASLSPVPEVLDVILSVSPKSSSCVTVLTSTDPGPGLSGGLSFRGLPFVVSRAPRSVRRASILSR